MSKFIFRRFLIFPPMLFVMSVIIFAVIQAPPGNFVDDWVRAMEEEGEGIRSDDAQVIIEQYGLDKPMYVQYWKWISGMLRWDFGQSLFFRKSVNELINERLPLTITLSLFTILFTWTLAIPIGIISAVKQYSIIDYCFTFMSYIGVGTPNFLLALIMMWAALTTLNMNTQGLFSFEYVDAPWSVARVIDMLKHIWVPMIILGTSGTAGLTRVMRANLLDEMSKPYVETARAKGLPGWKLVLKYPVRLAINPFVSTIGWELPDLFSGSLIVATVLNLPTMGPLLLEALRFQDMFMGGSMLMILTVLTVIGTLISDILLGWLDPRIRMEA